MRLFVENLPFEVTEFALYHLFETFGCITQINICRGVDGKSQGAAYVELKKDHEGTSAIKELDAINFMNRFLRVYEM